MYGINFNTDKISYRCCVQEAIDSIALLIESEYKSSLYYEKLISISENDSDRELIESIADDEKHHIQILKKIYLDFTGRNHVCSLQLVGTGPSYKNAIMWALLDKFKIVKIYNSIFENLVNERHKASILRIINDELAHIGELNYMLLNEVHGDE